MRTARVISGFSRLGWPSIAAVGIAALVSLGLGIPRVVENPHTPELHIAAVGADDCLRADARAARGLEHSTVVDQLKRLYLDQGLAEVNGRETTVTVRERANERSRVAATLPQATRAKIMAGLRAWAALEFDANVTSDRTLRRRDDVMGSFPDMLNRYGLLKDGVLVAPAFVARTLYKARFNAIYELGLTEGMNRLERLSYFGWLALHAHEAPLTKRLEALQRYEESGGARAEEARGVLLLGAGQPNAALDFLTRAYERAPRTWLRNYVASARRMKMQSEDESPRSAAFAPQCAVPWGGPQPCE